jgi:hypothetical protein
MSAYTVTVTKKGKRYVITYSRLPGEKFGPFDFAEAGRELFLWLPTRMAARNLVLDASEHGSATAECVS